MPTCIQCLFLIGSQEVLKQNGIRYKKISYKYAFFMSDKIPSRVRMLILKNNIELIQDEGLVLPPHAAFEAIKSQIIIERKRPLRLFCTSFNIRLMRRLLRSRKGPRYRINSYFMMDYPSTLKVAVVQEERFALIESLVRANPNLLLRGEGQRTLLYLAVEEGHRVLVDLLLKSGADVTRRAEYGTTPLHVAVSKKSQISSRLFFAQSLVARGAEVDAEDRWGTPLRAAVEAGSIDVVRFLLSKGANVNYAERTWQLTPLHVAVKLVDELAAPMVQLLFRYGADPTLTDWLGDPPLLSIGENSFRTLQIFAEQAVAPDSSGNGGETILLRAIRDRSFKLVDRILNLRPDPGVRGNKEAFYFALQHSDGDHTAIAQKMLAQGFTVATEDMDDERIFFGAIQKGLMTVVEDFLNNRRELINRCCYTDLETPLEYALEYKHDALVQFFLVRGATIRPQAFSKVNFEWLKIFLATQSIDKGDPSWVRAAVKNPNTEVLRLVLEYGCDPNAEIYLEESSSWADEDDQVVDLKAFELLTKFGAQWFLKDLTYFYDVSHEPAFLDHLPTKVIGSDLLGYAQIYKAATDQFVKLVALNPEADLVAEYFNSNLELPRRNYLENLKAQCKAEVGKLQEEISDTCVTYRDILVKEVDVVSCFARNGVIVETMEPNLVRQRFPIYANLLNCRFKKGVWLKDLRGKAVLALRLLFARVRRRIPDDVIEVIVKFLSYRDLIILPECLKSTRKKREKSWGKNW